MTKKIEDWEPHLSDFLTERMAEPFKWGTNDCVSLTVGAIHAMTGKDLHNWGKYDDKYGAAKVLRDYFGMNKLKSFTRLFKEAGFEKTDSIDTGSVGFVEMENLDPEASRMFGGVTLSLGFAGGVVAPGEEGLVLCHDYKEIRAWRL